MLGISVPTLIQAISGRVDSFVMWFFIVLIFLAIIGTTICYFLLNNAKNTNFFIYEVILIIYITCWVYGIARIISITENPSVKWYGYTLTMILFIGYGLWGLFYHRYEQNKTWKDSILNSIRVKFAVLSIFFMVAMTLIQMTHLLG